MTTGPLQLSAPDRLTQRVSQGRVVSGQTSLGQALQVWTQADSAVVSVQPLAPPSTNADPAIVGVARVSVSSVDGPQQTIDGDVPRWGARWEVPSGMLQVEVQQLLATARWSVAVVPGRIAPSWQVARDLDIAPLSTTRVEPPPFARRLLVHVVSGAVRLFDGLGVFLPAGTVVTVPAQIGPIDSDAAGARVSLAWEV